MKKIALISTFCDTDEKIEVLRNYLIGLRDHGIDTMIISPIVLPSDIVQLATYSFFTKENPVLAWPEYGAIVHQEFHDGDRTFTLNNSLLEYGYAGLWQDKKMAQLALTYDYDIHYLTIYDTVLDESVEKAFERDDLRCNFWANRRGSYISQASLHLIALDRENLAKFQELITKESYISRGMQSYGVDQWILSTVNEHFRDSVFERHCVTDCIVFNERDHHNFSDSPHYKIFVQKCDLEKRDVDLIVYHFAGEKRIRVETNINSTEEICSSPWVFTVANGSSEGLTKFVVEVDGTRHDLLQRVKEIGTSSIQFHN